MMILFCCCAHPLALWPHGGYSNADTAFEGRSEELPLFACGISFDYAFNCCGMSRRGG